MFRRPDRLDKVVGRAEGQEVGQFAGRSVQPAADTGAGLYACKASVDLFGLDEGDFIEQVEDIITVGEFYEIAAGGQIIFT